MRVLGATTANDGHIGPIVPFLRACVVAGHEVRVAAPASFAAAVEAAGFTHEPFADVPPELVGPIMARLPSVTFDEANELMVRDVFARLDAQAALPSLLDTLERWRPRVVVRESAELASLAAAERAGVPHVHVCIGMHEVAERFAELIGDPLDELGRLAGLSDGRLRAALAAEQVFSLVPEILDHVTDHVVAGADTFLRFHEPIGSADRSLLPDWGGREGPLIYVTFGSVTGSLPPFAGVFREALDALADVDVRVLMTVGRKVDPTALGPWPANARVLPWCPQAAVLAQAAAMIGHGGFGTTMGALAAGGPQVVVPIFTFDQVVNGEHVASVGAGHAVEVGPGSVQRAAALIPRMLEVPDYTTAARRIAIAMRELPPPAEAVPHLVELAG
jgi:UDP:flavonoid glycosyltransferase YjiC (YdhE family)